MPLRGGASDKIGNRYEDYWTIRTMIRVLNEHDKADYIYLENPGPDGDGVEFFIGCNGEKEFHQVKRQISEGSWTSKSLRNVLIKFWEKLRDEKVTCKFISTTSSSLQNLTENARSSSSYIQFKNYFLSSNALESAFNDLCEIWDNPNPEDVYDAIKRIWFVPQDEMELRRFVTDYLEGHIAGNPNTVRSVLFEYIFGNVHKKINTQKIWNHLKKLNYHFYAWYKDSTVIGRIDNINESYERQHRSFVSYMIPNDSSNDIINKIQENKDIIITGPAGIGKSTVILQTIDYLKNKNIPFITLDVDNLEFASSAMELGEKLRLPNSPVNILENIAQGEHCILILDQLDNLSLVPATRPQFFYCIYEMIEKAKLVPNISLILACRQFDIDNDARLSDLIKKFEIDKIEIGNLSTEQVKDYIINLGLNFTDFGQNLNIWLVPLHLRLLSEIVRSSDYTNFSFDSYLDLYKAYWKTKKKDIKIKIGDSGNWNNVIDILCEYMSNNQVLYVNEELLDDYSEYAEAMASEGVLILDSNRYSFFHRSFFDYAFARRFTVNNKDIMEFITEDEQHLSRRSQVRQILLYKRALNFDDYLKDIKSLLNSPKIRFHIKKIIFEILSEFNDPKKEEWDEIWPFISDKESNLHDLAWGTIYGSLDWFKLLDSNGIFKDMIENHDYLMDKFMWIFFGILKKTDRVAEFIEPYVDKSPEWNQKIISTVIWADLSKEKYFKLVLRLIDKGIFEKVYKDRDYWEDIQHRMINKLDNNYPERSIEIISSYLKRKIKLALDSGEKNPFSDDLIPIGAFDNTAFENLARQSSKEFVDKILPKMLFLMDINSYKEAEKPFKDRIWGSRSYMGERFGADDIILHSMEIALSKLTYADYTSFEQWENVLINSDFETSHYLLVRAYALNASKLSRKAVNYLYNNPSSLEIGSFNSRAGATMLLIKHISPHCTYFDFKKLEQILLNYFTYKSVIYKWVCTFYPDKCEKFYFYEYRQADVQLNLIKSIPVSLHSTKIRSRIRELSEMYRVSYNEPTTKMEVITVTSPINENDARQFNNEEWLNAISTYNKRREMLEGGPYELSGVLEKLVKDDPDRFTKLVLKFPDDTNIHYFNAVLRGITDSDADLNSVINVCKRCHELSNKPCGLWITQPIVNYAKDKLPDEILKIISWYAINDPDPSEELWDSNNSRGMVYYGGNIHDAGLNSVRGMVAESIGKMIYYNKDIIPYFIPTLNKMVNDSSIAVRSRVAKTLIMVLTHDKPLALELFKKLINTDDVLLKTPYVAQFVYYNLKNNFEQISEIINRMLISKDPDVNEIGAIATSYASLLFQDKLPQLDFCLYTSEMHRLGVAKAFVEYLPYNSSPSLVITILSTLFKDPSEKVRNAAYRSFLKLNNGNIYDYIDLIRSFIYNNHSTDFKDLAYTLKDIINLPDITLEICEQFFKIVMLEASDIRTQNSRVAGIFAELILRIYGQTEDKEINKRCLDLIDYMLEINVLGIEDEISKYMNSTESLTK